MTVLTLQDDAENKQPIKLIFIQFIDNSSTHTGSEYNRQKYHLSECKQYRHFTIMSQLYCVASDKFVMTLRRFDIRRAEMRSFYMSTNQQFLIIKFP